MANQTVEPSTGTEPPASTSAAGSLAALAGLLLAAALVGGALAGAIANALATGPYLTGILGGVATVVCLAVGGTILGATSS